MNIDEDSTGWHCRGRAGLSSLYFCFLLNVLVAVMMVFHAGENWEFTLEDAWAEKVSFSLGDHVIDKPSEGVSLFACLLNSPQSLHKRQAVLRGSSKGIEPALPSQIFFFWCKYSECAIPDIQCIAGSLVGFASLSPRAPPFCC